MNKNRILMIVFTALVLGMGLFLAEGPVLKPDSAEYIAGEKYLPMLYPTLLYVFQKIFGSAYLLAIVLFQTILATWAIVWLAETLIDCFQVESRLIGVFILLMLVGTFFVDNLNILDGYETCNLWILTEGISYPLFFVFVTFSIKMIQMPTLGNVSKTVIVAALLTLCRKQMLACFCMVFLYLAYLFIVHKVKIQMALKEIVIIGIALALTLGVQSAYQNMETEKLTYYRVAELSHLFFFSDREDAEQIQNADEKRLYLEIYDGIRERQLHVEDAEQTLVGLSNAYLYNFLPIGDVIYSALDEYGQNLELTGDKEESMAYDIMGDYIEVLQGHTGQWMKTVVIQLPLIFSVSIFTYQQGAGALCMGYGLCMVLLYCGLLLYRIVKNRQIDGLSLFAGFILIYIVATGLATTFAIRSLGRYMFYTCGLFYIAGLLMVVQLIQGKWGQAGKRSISS